VTAGTDSSWCVARVKVTVASVAIEKVVVTQIAAVASSLIAVREQIASNPW
jgi:hypothetical protein